MKKPMRSLARFMMAVLVGGVFLGASVPASATNIQDVVSAKGVHAWLVQDDKLPLISLSFGFRGGVEQDPVDKQGLAELTTSLMTEGAGPYDAAALQQQLADHSISLSFSAERDALVGSAKMLRSEADAGFDLLHTILTQPHFDDKMIEMRRDQQLTAVRVQLGEPGWQARYALFQKVFANHPYNERHLGSLKTVRAITQADIRKFAGDHLAIDNLSIVVTGDISAAELRVILDKVFGDLPRRAKLSPIPEVKNPEGGDVILVPREGTQTELLFAMPGPKRDSPDWYAAEVANYILGGGGFSSRLMQNVRDKKGLTYGISTGLSAMDHAGVFVGQAAVDNPKTGQAWDIIKDTMEDFHDDGVTKKEIAAAKDYLTGSLPLEMTSTDRISSLLLGVQLEGYGRDYLEHRNAMIRAVTEDDVDRAIRDWFDPDRLTLVMVGKPEGPKPVEIQSQVHD